MSPRGTRNAWRTLPQTGDVHRLAAEYIEQQSAANVAAAGAFTGTQASTLAATPTGNPDRRGGAIAAQNLARTPSATSSGLRSISASP